MSSTIAPDKRGYQVSENNFSSFSMKTYVVSTHYKQLDEALLMSTTTYFTSNEYHNIFYF